MNGGRCWAVLVIVGAPGGKVITGKWGKFHFFVSIFLRRELNRVVIFASFSILANVGLSFPSCAEKGGRVNLFWHRGGQEQNFTHVPWGMFAHYSGAWRSQRLQFQWGQLWQGHSCRGGTCEQVVGSGLLFQSQTFWAQALEYREWMRHAAPNLFAKIGVVKPSFWFILGGRGWAIWPWLVWGGCVLWWWWWGLVSLRFVVIVVSIVVAVVTSSLSLLLSLSWLAGVGCWCLVHGDNTKWHWYQYSHLTMLFYKYLQAILFGDLLVATGLHHKCWYKSWCVSTRSK